MSTHIIPFFNIKKKITLIYPKSAAMGFFFQGTQERVRKSRGKRAISVRATEVLLYHFCWSQARLIESIHRKKTPMK